MKENNKKNKKEKKWEKEFDEKFLSFGEFPCENGQTCEIKPEDVKNFILFLLSCQLQKIKEKVEFMRGNVISACNTDRTKEGIAMINGYIDALSEVLKMLEIEYNNHEI